MQLPRIETVEQGIEPDMESAHGVCIHETFLSFSADSINTL